MGGTYSGTKHRVIAYNDVTQEIKEKVVRPKWQCTGTTTIIKPHINYANVDASGRSRNCQCNTILVVKVKKAKERTVMEADVDFGQIELLGNFGQSRYGSGNKYKPPSPHPQP